MKQLIVLCITTTCNTILWSMEWDDGQTEFTQSDATGSLDGHEACEKCRNQPKKPIIFSTTPTRFGEEKTEDFQTLMAKRKIDNRKKSGKGPPRGGGR